MGVKVIRRDKVTNETSAVNSQGSYAISSVGARPWSMTKVADNLPKTRRVRPEPTIVNPVFKECVELTTDPTWKSIFNDAAYGKFPRGFSLKDGYLVHKVRNKASRVELPKNPEEVLEESIKFFKDKAGIMSQEDQRRSQKEYEEFLVNTGQCFPKQWSHVRKKKIQEVLISTYISQISRKYSLSSSEKEDLKNKIKIGFILGCFKNDQIVLNRGYIEEIKGLCFDPDKREFYIDYQQAPKQLKRSRRVEAPPKPKRSFYQLWLKFLSNLEKEIHNTKNESRSTKSTENSSYEPVTSNDQS